MRREYLISVVLVLFQVPNSLQDCRKVQTIQNVQDLWCNTIQDLEKHGISDASDVSIYDGNTLPVVSNKTYTKPPNLKVVLTDDAADDLSPNTYKILKDLSSQLLKKQQLTTIQKGLFSNLPLLKLYLSDNGISSIQVGAFSNMQSLKELHITHNNLRSVETGIFNSLSVETLALSNNKISAIKKNALFNMKNLKHLHLEGNLLTEFRPDSFISFGSVLETLLLQHNNLAEFDRAAVKSLENLRILNLGNNNIRKVIIYSFETLLRLEELILSHNQIQELNSDVFAEGMPALTKLQINNNRLSYLTPKLLGRLSSLKYIRLGGNPWMCPCFDEILSWLNDGNINQFCDYDYYTGKRPVCVVPDVRTTTCDYSQTTNQYIQKYAEANAPDNKVCSI